MWQGKNILAVVPARSGSKGIPDKNMRQINGISLIGHAGLCLQQIKWIDAKIISTDSSSYAKEGERYGLAAPFLRPAELSSDTATAVETIAHAIKEADVYYAKRFEIILIVEPTSPLRQARDIETAIKLLVETGADSVVTVSKVALKFYPDKILKIDQTKLSFFTRQGNAIANRQHLAKEALYWRNGVCYALTRNCIIEKGLIISDNTMPLIVERDVANIDDWVELAWAEFLAQQETIKQNDKE